MEKIPFLQGSIVDISINENVEHFCLFQLIPEVAQLKILHSLSIQEVLNFRVVCSCTAEWVKKYTSPYFTQRLKSCTLKFSTAEEVRLLSELTWTPPFSRFHFAFQFQSLQDFETGQRFASRFGNSVRYLRVASFNFCYSDEEYEFYQSFRNLQDFHIEAVMSRRQNEPSWVLSRHPNLTQCAQQCDSSLLGSQRRVPEILLESLESLTVDFSNQSNYVYNLLMNCPKLKYLSLGKMYPSDTSIFALLEPSADDEPNLRFKKISEYIGWRYHNRRKPFDLDLSIDMKEVEDHMEADRECLRKYLQYFGAAGIHLLHLKEDLMKIILEQV